MSLWTDESNQVLIWNETIYIKLVLMRQEILKQK